LLQDDIAKFVSDPTPPPRLVDIPDEGKSKAKERREVGEGDDTVAIEDTSNEEDGETLQERFYLRSRFSQPGLLLTVCIRVKVQVDLQADKSPVLVKGSFFPRMVNPRYRIHGTMCNARSNLISGKHFDV
jgi:hypothetical protein